MNKKLILAIFSLTAILSTTNRVNAQEKEKLSDVNNLSAWNFILEKNNVPAEQIFSISNGIIHIKGEPLGYMYTKKKYGNYHLHAEWQWPGGVESNSGIFLLIDEANNPFPNGIECQLKAGNAGDFVLLGGSDLWEYKNPEGGRPKFPVVNMANQSSEKKAGEWNEADIYCHNGIITIYINGIYQNKGTNKVREGHIGLQSEGKDILFRNVTVTPLP